MRGEFLATGTWVGVAAVIAAVGSATSSVISALNGRTAKRIESKVDKANGGPK